MANNSGLKWVVAGVATCGIAVGVYAFRGHTGSQPTVATEDPTTATTTTATPATPHETSPTTPAKTAGATTTATTVVATKAAGLSRECTELWKNLTASNVALAPREVRPPSGSGTGARLPDDALQNMRLLPQIAQACEGSPAALATAQTDYQAKCAAVFEGRTLDDRVEADRQALEACYDASLNLRTLLSVAANKDKALSEINDPQVLMDRLMAASGMLKRAPGTPGPPPKFDADKLGDIAATSMRLLEVADSGRQKNFASRLFVMSNAQSMGLTYWQFVSGGARDPATAGNDDAATQQAKIDELKHQVETYNPTFFKPGGNRPRR
ncbi:MAG: hypothetical protein HY075_16080 [Deltaproteobacteria bacterium]|nr:hypothetical protein [Deltaproteobacteria bacterium]